MIDLSTWRCEPARGTLPEEGETLTRFAVKPGDVIMADRGLAHRRGIRHVVGQGGDVVGRMNRVSVPLEERADQGTVFPRLPRLRPRDIGAARDWLVQGRDEPGTRPVRVCAIGKSEEQTRKSQEKLQRTASKKGRILPPETLEAAAYVVVLTTLHQPGAASIRERYRHRWQVELAFKRLKSLLQLGHLQKTDPEGAKAWLQGKLRVATLIAMPIAVGERFSPGGCFLRTAPRTSLPLA